MEGFGCTVVYSGALCCGSLCGEMFCRSEGKRGKYIWVGWRGFFFLVGEILLGIIIMIVVGSLGT